MIDLFYHFKLLVEILNVYFSSCHVYIFMIAEN